jgi:hypothetical protein
MHVRDTHCWSCGSAQGNHRCSACGEWMDDHEAHRESFDLETINPFGPSHSLEESFKTQAELEAGKAAFLERWKGAPPYDGFPEECLQLLHRPADPRSQCHSEPAEA